MANKGLFRTPVGKLVPRADARNREGAPAYAYTPKHRLAQLASTGCFGGAFYATAERQLEELLAATNEVEPEFVARAAVHARQRGRMKDAPAVLAAVLTARKPELLDAIFPRVVDDGKMLRNYVQVVRSGIAGRKSLGTHPRRLVRNWLQERTEEELFRASVGASPSLADVIRMVHPRPVTPERSALYGYLLGREHDAAALPDVVRRFEDFKAGRTREAPDVPFLMLTALPLDRKAWCGIAERASWQTTRMNLNTFARHGVFEDEAVTRKVAGKLGDPQEVRRAKAFPYQLLAAYAMSAGTGVPAVVREALQDALEAATANVPALEGRVVVCPDVSGSMRSPLTGVRKGATTAVRCVDVAALMAASVLRANPRAEVLAFENEVVDVEPNPRDSVMTNAARLAAVGGGGTNCSAPLARLNERKEAVDLVLFVSDNQSWVDAGGGRGTALLREWNALAARRAGAKLVCIDLQPYGTTQAQERHDVLNVGGFSDAVFDVVADFAAGRLDARHWVGAVDAVPL